MRSLRRAFLALLITALATAPAHAHKPITSRYTFAGDVHPILEARCAPCHRSGGPAPMPLGTYGEVRPWAQAIQERVLDGTMPPWFAEPGHERLLGGRALTAREIDVLADWAAGGAPAGAQAPEGGGKTGTAEILPAPEGGLEVRSIPLDGAAGLVPVAEDLHLAAWWVEPGEGPIPRAAVLHAELPAGRGAADRVVLGSWITGQGPLRLPDGAAFSVAAGSILRLEVLPGKGRGAPAPRGGIILRLGSIAGTPRGELRETVLERAGPIEHRGGARVALLMPLGDGGPARLVLRGDDPDRPRVLLEISRASAEWPITYSFAEPPAVGPREELAWEPGVVAARARLWLLYAP